MALEELEDVHHVASDVGEDLDDSRTSEGVSSDEVSDEQVQHVIEFFHKDDDITTVGRTCFWFGGATLLGAVAYFEFIGRDLAHNGQGLAKCIPKGKYAAGISTDNAYLIRVGGWLEMWSGLDSIDLFVRCWAVLLYFCAACGIDYFSVLKKSPLVSTNKADALIGASKMTLIWVICRMTFIQVALCNPALSFLKPLEIWIPCVAYVASLMFGVWWTGLTVPKLVFSACVSTFTAAGVTPIDGFVGNWICSLSKPLVNIGYTVCYYTYGDIVDGSKECYDWFHGQGFNIGLVILCFGNSVRFLQLLRQFRDTRKLHPNITNAAKYFLSICVTLFSALHLKDGHKLEVWFFLTLFTTGFSFWWDVFMDWGLVEVRSSRLCMPFPPCRLRRRRLLASKGGPYVCAIVADFFARIMFIYTLVPQGNFHFMSVQFGILRYCFFFAPAVEIIRRAMWSGLSFEYKWLGELEKRGLVLHAQTAGNHRNVAAQTVQSRYFKLELAAIVLVCIAVPGLMVLSHTV